MPKATRLKAVLHRHQQQQLALQKKRKPLITTATTDKHVKSNPKKSKPNASAGQDKKESPSVMPYAASDRLLLIGEANFSFAVALVRLLWLSVPLNDDVRRVFIPFGGMMAATTLDSKELTLQKYPDAVENIQQLEQWGIPVLFDFDATKSECYKRLLSQLRRQSMPCSFNRIVFNFPHVGKGIKDQERNILANQRLLLDFLHASRLFLEEQSDQSRHRSGGKGLCSKGYAMPLVPKFKTTGANEQIHITLKTGSPYDEWQLKKLSKSVGLFCLRSFRFLPEVYPGYAHRRTLGFHESKSAANNEELKDGCRTWIFGLKRDDSMTLRTDVSRSDSED